MSSAGTTARSRADGTALKLANGLGWFSIGLGAAELLAPGAMGRLIGIRQRFHRKALLRLYGLREIAAGVMILADSKPTAGVWSRVAGDVVNVISLGSAATAYDAERGRLMAAAAAAIGVTAVDWKCAQTLSAQDSLNAGNGGTVHRINTVTIGRGPDEVYAFWREFENLPRFMSNLLTVRATAENSSHWRAKGPAGTEYEWDAEITEDEPGKRIAWKTTSGDINHSGSVAFSRTTRADETIVRVDLFYDPPAGSLGVSLAKLVGAEPGQEIAGDLRRLKQLLEIGEVVHSDASIHRGLHPAQPEAVSASVTRQAQEAFAR